MDSVGTGAPRETHAVAAAGFPRLVQANKTTVWRILKEHDIKPHRIRYYLEKRDPDFDRKMREVLMVYQEVSLYADKTGQGDQPASVYTASVDEKPGAQAIGLTAPETFHPYPAGEHHWREITNMFALVPCPSWRRSICIRGKSSPTWSESKHRRREFIDLLKRLDAHYSADAVILVLDNHSAHISKETMAYLASRPGRFEYAHTLKHGSWLNLIECAFPR